MSKACNVYLTPGSTKDNTSLRRKQKSLLVEGTRKSCNLQVVAENAFDDSTTCFILFLCQVPQKSHRWHICQTARRLQFGIYRLMEITMDWKITPYCWWFRNPVNSPVDMVNISHYLQGFSTIPTVVVWDFWTINSIVPRKPTRPLWPVYSGGQ